MNSLIQHLKPIPSLICLDPAEDGKFMLVKEANEDVSGEFLIFHYLASFLSSTRQHTEILIFSFQHSSNHYFQILRKLMPNIDRNVMNVIEMQDSNKLSFQNYLNEDIRFIILDGISVASLVLQNSSKIIDAVRGIFAFAKKRKASLLIRNTIGYFDTLDRYLESLFDCESGIKFYIQPLQSVGKCKDADGVMEMTSFNGQSFNNFELLFKFMDNCQVSFFAK